MSFLPDILNNVITVITLWSVSGFFVVLFCIYTLRYFVHRSYRTPVAFQMRLFLVTLPKDAAKDQSKDERKPATLETIREKIAIAEAFLSTIGGLKAERGLKAWFFGREDHLSFEIVAARGLISFYVVVPPKLEQYIQQQIHAQYPEAQIDRVDDYNIFSPQGVTKADMLHMHRQFLFPLKTYRKIEADPLNALTNALSRLGEHDGAAIQFVVRSAKGVWHRAGRRVAAEMQQGKKIDEALRIVLGSIVSKIFRVFRRSQRQHTLKDEKQETYRLSPLEEEMVKGIEEKTSKAGLDVNVRIVVSARDKHAAEQQLENIINAFAQFNLYEYGNSLKPTHARRIDWMIRDFIYRHFSERHAMLMNTEELASVFHFPLPTTETQNIQWLLAKKAPPPVNMPREGLILGRSIFRGEETLVRMKPEDRRRHLYMIGMTGVGKSNVLASMAAQDIEAGHGVCIIDPHGSLAEDVLARVPRTRAEDVVYFDPSDIERPIGLNMLEAGTEQEKDFATQEMIAIFYKLVTDPSMIGPMFEHYMRNAMLTLMADPKNQNTIVEIPRILTDKEFQRLQLRSVEDPIIRAFWEKELPQTSGQTKGEMLPYLVSKIGRFIENQMIRNIIGQQASGFNLRDVMDKKKILIVNLSKGKIGEMNANLLGLILVSKLQMAALARADMPESERHDFYLYIDEFQNFITDSIATILAEARKYRLNLIIGHQYIGQLVHGGGVEGKQGDTRVRDAVFGNVGTLLSFRIGVDDAEFMAKQFAPVFSEYDLINIPRYNAYARLMIDNQAARPFSMETLAPVPGDVGLAEKIKQLSRLKYGRDRRIVEAEILERSRLAVEPNAE